MMKLAIQTDFCEFLSIIHAKSLLSIFQLWTISLVCGESTPDVKRLETHYEKLTLHGQQESFEYSRLKGIQSIGTLEIKITDKESNDQNILYEMHEKLGTWQGQFLSIATMIVFGRYPEGFFDIFIHLPHTRAVDLMHYNGYGFPFDRTTNLAKVSVSGRTLENLVGLWSRRKLKHLSLDITNNATMVKYSGEIARSIRENDLETLTLSHCGVEEYKALCGKSSLQQFDIKFNGQRIQYDELGSKYDFHFTRNFQLSANDFDDLPSASGMTINVSGEIKGASLKTIWRYSTESPREIVNLFDLTVLSEDPELAGELCSLKHFSESIMDLMNHSNAGIGRLQINFSTALTIDDYIEVLEKLRVRYNVAGIRFRLDDDTEHSFNFAAVKKELMNTHKVPRQTTVEGLFKMVFRNIIQTVNSKLDKRLERPEPIAKPDKLKDGKPDTSKPEPPVVKRKPDTLMTFNQDGKTYTTKPAAPVVKSKPNKLKATRGEYQSPTAVDEAPL